MCDILGPLALLMFFGGHPLNHLTVSLAPADPLTKVQTEGRVVEFRQPYCVTLVLENKSQKTVELVTAFSPEVLFDFKIFEGGKQISKGQYIGPYYNFFSYFDPHRITIAPGGRYEYRCSFSHILPEDKKNVKGNLSVVGYLKYNGLQIQSKPLTVVVK